MVVFTVLYDFIQYKHFSQFGYNKPYLLYGISLILFAIIIPIKNINFKHLFIFCCVYNLLHSAISIHYFPLAIERSDMLAAIKVSLEQYFNGLSPYAKVSSTIGIPPYLPITMLSFAPAFLLKIDFRCLGIVYWMISLVLVYRKFEILSLAAKMAICLLVLNPYWLMRHDLYFQFFLLELVILSLYLPNMNFYSKSFIFGISISTLQFAWILFPFLLLNTNKIKSSLLLFITATVIAVIISSTYTHNGILDFIHAIFLHQEYKHAYTHLYIKPGSNRIKTINFVASPRITI